MDKQRVTSHIRDEELRIKMYKIVDLCNGVLKNYDVRKSDFLNPFEIKNAISIVNSESNLKYSIDGGYDESERSVINIFPYYMEEAEDDSIRFLRIDGNFKFRTVSHRDYLGSILGLGIKREKIGDILVHEDYCQIIVDSDICDFILMNFEKVGRNTIKVSEISRNELIKPMQAYSEKSVSVSSLRLDNIICSAFNMSRQESEKFIKSDFVQVDYEKINTPSKMVSEGALISVRRKGKFILKEIGGTSKKGKIRVLISIYV